MKRFLVLIIICIAITGENSNSKRFEESSKSNIVDQLESVATRLDSAAVNLNRSVKTLKQAK